MSSSWYSSALREFSTILTQTEANATFVRDSYRWISDVTAVVDFKLLKANAVARQAYNNFVRGKAAAPEDLFAGLFVVVSAAFERFVRRLVSSGVRKMDGEAKRFDDLPKRLQDYHTCLGGRALATVLEPQKDLKVDFVAISKSLGSCIPGSESFELNADLFSMFVANLKPESLENVLKRIDVEGFWDDVGRDQQIQKYFGTSSTREAAKCCRNYVEEFTSKRNKISHRGDSVQGVESEELLAAVSFFQVFAKPLCLAVHAKLPDF